jgi:beta-lactamase superfamily II metal-dependent hydrolase
VLCVIWSAIWLWERPVTRLTVLPVDGGHAVYLRGPGRGNGWLVDCGGKPSVDSLLKPYLRAQGVNRLPNFLLTHGESDFSDGAPLVCDLFRPRNIYVSQTHFLSSDYNTFLRAIRTNSVLRPPVRSDDQFGPFTAFFPAGARLPKADDRPMLLRADINGTRVLLLSDLSHAGQNALLNGDTNNLRADIVVAGVPGDGEPLDDAFLDFVQPRVIIIADSDVPVRRHAASDLKVRLAQRKVPVFYTSEMRSVTIAIRPGSWKVEAMDGTRASGTSSK